MNPAARQVQLLQAQAKAWAESPPPYPVLAAGSTGGIPAVAALLRVIAGMPQGRVVLPGLDLALDDPAWDQIEDSHPQAGLRRLLTRLNAARGDVRGWEEAAASPTGRTVLLNRALLPPRRRWGHGAIRPRRSCRVCGAWTRRTSRRRRWRSR